MFLNINADTTKLIIVCKQQYRNVASTLIKLVNKHIMQQSKLIKSLCMFFSSDIGKMIIMFYISMLRYERELR